MQIEDGSCLVKDATQSGCQPQRTSYSSCSACHVRIPDDSAGLLHGGPAFHSVHRLRIRCWFGHGVDGHACPGSREYWAGGQQTAQSRALAAVWLCSQRRAWLTTAFCLSSFLPDGARGRNKVVDGPFYGQKPLVSFLHPHYPRWRSG